MYSVKHDDLYLVYHVQLLLSHDCMPTAQRTIITIMSESDYLLSAANFGSKASSTEIGRSKVRLDTA